MNCEKCKNKKATLFYADEEGNRHALCASCGTLQGRIGTLRSAEEKNEETMLYVPEITLTALLRDDIASKPCLNETDPALICGSCKTSSDDVKASGRVGCPDCYLAFGALLFSDMPADTSLLSRRMPMRRRRAIERQRSIEELRLQISSAVAKENYELAAALRDKVKSLENEK